MITDLLTAALRDALVALDVDPLPDTIGLERPANRDHGDWSSNVSLATAKKAGKNPWNANTLEWTTESPPPHGNWPGELPTVYRGPYEYSVPGRESDFWPQDQKD